MMTTIQNIWPYIAVVLIGLSKSLRNDVLDKVIVVTSMFGVVGDFLKKNLLEKLMPKPPGVIINQARLQDVFGKMFTTINQLFDFASNSLRNHALSIADTIEPDPRLRPWRMFGYFFQLFFLIMFVFGDMIQIVNNLALLFPQDISEVPNWAQNLTLSLLMSSVGIAIAASFILAEFAEITRFGKWNELKGSFRRWIYSLVWFCLVTILVIDAILAISRIRSIPEVVQILLPETIARIIVWASIASSLVIIPMIIITAMFLQGFVGFAIIYIIIVWIISFCVDLLHFIFVGLVWISTFGIAYLIEFILRVLLWGLVALLYITGYIFMGLGISIQQFLKLIQAILNLIYFPMDSIITWICRTIK